jgi:hypothetical protein
MKLSGDTFLKMKQVIVSQLPCPFPQFVKGMPKKREITGRAKLGDYKPAICNCFTFFKHVLKL